MVMPWHFWIHPCGALKQSNVHNKKVKIVLLPMTIWRSGCCWEPTCTSTDVTGVWYRCSSSRLHLPRTVISPYLTDPAMLRRSDNSGIFDLVSLSNLNLKCFPCAASIFPMVSFIMWNSIVGSVKIYKQCLAIDREQLWSSGSNTQVVGSGFGLESRQRQWWQQNGLLTWINTWATTRSPCQLGSQVHKTPPWKIINFKLSSKNGIIVSK